MACELLMAGFVMHTPSSVTRDPESSRINILGSGFASSVKTRLLSAIARSPLSWRLNFSVDASVGDRPIKVPVLLGRGYQNLSIGEPWLFRAFSKVLGLRPGAFVDVGVNLGQTLIKVKLIDRSRAYFGFEPNPECSQYVTELIKINGFNDCTLFPVGLSSSASVATLFAKNDAVDPSASLVPGFRTADRYQRRQYVPVFPGDTLLADVERIALLKIDVEGGELDVIAGMLGTLARCSPIIFCEILPVFDESTENGSFRLRRQNALLAHLRSLDYAVFRMMHDESVVELAGIETHSDLALTNYAFVPAAEVDRFRRLFKTVTSSATA